MATTMSDLPEDLVMEILSRVSLTNLRALRCTCKTWNALSQNHVFGKTDAGSMFLGFMVIDSKLCSMKLDLQRTRNNGNLVYRPTTKRADICKVFHWDGLLLCVTKSRLVVWNPYLRQIKWIQPMDKLHLGDMYGVGYENNNNNRNHKILRLLNYSKWSELGPFFQIYDFNSNSWRVLDVDPGSCVIKSGVSLKGNTYFLAEEETWVESFVCKNQFYLFCFDFTAESFGQRLVLPFGACVRFSKTVVLSCVRDEQLAVLHHGKDDRLMDIWITTRIEPNVASWTRFLRLEMRPFRHASFNLQVFCSAIGNSFLSGAEFATDNEHPSLMIDMCNNCLLKEM
ncbi:hypothetical protein DY000_02004674 [Brassica cretica]|uniref:F-box domain-containing protein n=1 Tax=Brassica cretica TaxID=69181 RepID=A0ABQ7C564_BRACR|nr:hypothetical protein DY000_02004674 [Brassica cretica]